MSILKNIFGAARRFVHAVKEEQQPVPQKEKDALREKEKFVEYEKKYVPRIREGLGIDHRSCKAFYGWKNRGWRRQYAMKFK